MNPKCKECPSEGGLQCFCCEVVQSETVDQKCKACQYTLTFMRGVKAGINCPNCGIPNCYYPTEKDAKAAEPKAEYQKDEQPMSDESYGEQQHADDMDQQALYSDLRRGW